MSDKPVCFAGIKKLPVEVLHVTPVLLELSATLRVIITHTYFHMEMITVFFFPSQCWYSAAHCCPTVINDRRFFPHFLLSEIGKMISYGHQINTVIIRSYRGFQTFRYLFQRRCDHLSILHLSSSSASSSTAPSVSSSSSSSSPKTSLLSSSLASTKGKSTWTYLISILLWLVIFSRRATLPSLESWQEKAKQQHNDPSYHTS